MEFGQFLIEMTLMPTPKSVSLAGNVVDLEKLHRYRYFPAWITKNFFHPEELRGSNSVKILEFWQFLAEMTLMPTPGSVRLADKVVDLKKLHRYRYFPAWITKNFFHPEELQGSNRLKNHCLLLLSFVQIFMFEKVWFLRFWIQQVELDRYGWFSETFQGGPILALKRPPPFCPSSFSLLNKLIYR